MRQSKIEFYPDGFSEKGDPNGPKTMVINFFVSNNTRWKSLTKLEKMAAFELIEEFKGRLEDIQQELCPGA